MIFFTNGKWKTNESVARPAESKLVTLGLLLVEVQSFAWVGRLVAELILTQLASELGQGVV